MKKIFLILGIVLMCVGATAWAVAQDGASYSLRYKMTVTVETPEGEVSGYAVRQIANGSEFSFIPEVGNPAGVRGEAVVVDLGKRGILFALISHQSDLEFYNAFPIPGLPIGNGGSSPEGIKYYANLPTGAKGILNPSEPPGYPQLVMFSNINDPRSVMEAQIWERQANGKFRLKEDRMEELFGTGVKLKKITLEITREKLTKSIAKKLLWLDGLEEKKERLNGSTSIAVFSNQLSDNLGSTSFRMEN